MDYRMPEHFLWGAATASFQVEGHLEADGAGPSNWLDFCRKPGTVANDDIPLVGASQYTLYKEDVQLMKSLGIKAYRFSIAWPRVFPEGTGAPNPKGLDYYNRLVDELLANGITPYVTVFHWDLPSALEQKGGWRSKETSPRTGRLRRLCRVEAVGPGQKLLHRQRDHLLHRLRLRGGTVRPRLEARSENREPDHLQRLPRPRPRAECDPGQLPRRRAGRTGGQPAQLRAGLRDAGAHRSRPQGVPHPQQPHPDTDPRGALHRRIHRRAGRKHAGLHRLRTQNDRDADGLPRAEHLHAGAHRRRSGLPLRLSDRAEKRFASGHERRMAEARPRKHLLDAPFLQRAVERKEPLHHRKRLSRRRPGSPRRARFSTPTG